MEKNFRTTSFLTDFTIFGSKNEQKKGKIFFSKICREDFDKYKKQI
jgi:hypothetical protein